MTAKQEKRKKNIALLIISTIMALLTIALAGPQLGIASNKRNLSESPNITSSYPDLTVNGDASTLAIAWIENRGVYLRVRSEGTWGEKTEIFSGEGTQGAEDVAVAVKGNEVHIAYATLSSATPTETEVHYRKYGNPNDEVAADESGQEISWVDLAVAENGDVHLIWAQYQDGENGEIHYRKRDSGWGSATRIASEGNNHAPAAAIAGGYLHVAWKEDQTQNGVIYRRRELDGTWGESREVFTAQDTPGIPNVTAEGNDVIIVWDDCSGGECNLSYRQSNDAGSSWSGEAIGSYDSPGMTYLNKLRPTVTLNGDGRPTVAWHADNGTGRAVIYCTSAVEDGSNWLTPVVLSENALSNLGTAITGMGGDLLHAAYMQETGDYWDIYYENFSPVLTAQIDYVTPPNATLAETWVVSPTSPFQLDGSSSSSTSGLTLNYNWQLLETPEGSVSAAVAPQFSASPVFTADVEGYYTIKLEVSNGLATAQTTQQLLASSESDLTPHAQIAVNTLLPPNQEITLDGSGSSSPGGFDLTYNWQIAPSEGITLSNASSVSPTIIADVEGWYTVTLEVDNGTATDQDTKRILISKHDDVFPVAQIEADTIVAVNAPVPLDGSGSSGGGLEMDYHWSVSPDEKADLSNPMTVSPTFTATAEGWYTVTLVVDNGVATDQDTQQILATTGGDISPHAQIKSDTIVNLNNPVPLDGSSSSSPGGLDLTYRWWLSSEGEGATLSNTNSISSTFTATELGWYVVTLEVNNGMETDRDTQRILASGADGIVPQAQIRLGSFDLITDTPITLDGSDSFSPGDLDIEYNWWLPPSARERASLSNTTNISSTFTAIVEGSYTVTLEVNNGLATDQDTHVMLIEGETITPVYAQIDVASPIAVSETVTLNGSGSNGGEEPLTYQWSVSPDENTVLTGASTVSPTFSAAAEGWYTATLEVSNENGTDRDTQRILVAGNGGKSSPQAQITVDTPNPVPLNEPVILDGSNSSNSITYHWELSPEGGAILSNTTNISSTFTAEEPGWYTVTLEVDNGVATDSDTKQILAGSMDDVSPQAKISVEPSNPVSVGEIVYLQGDESSQGAGSTLTYDWELSPPAGSAASLSSPSAESTTFTADVKGWYTVTLGVDNGIATDSDTKQILAGSGSDVSPQAQIEATNRIPVGRPTTLDGSGSSSGGGFDLTYRWTVSPDDGGVTLSDTSAESPTFTANTAGWYTIILEVDNGILTDQDTHQIQVWQVHKVYLPLIMRWHGFGDE